MIYIYKLYSPSVDQEIYIFPDLQTENTVSGLYSLISLLLYIHVMLRETESTIFSKYPSVGYIRTES